MWARISLWVTVMAPYTWRGSCASTRRSSGPGSRYSHLSRRSYREDGRIKHETLGNVSALPAPAIEALRAVLAGKTLVVADEHVRTLRSMPHGHVAAVWAMARQLGLPALLGPAGRSRDLALALIVSRVVRPASKLPPAPGGPTSPWCRPGRGGRVQRRGVRGDGLAAGPSGRHRGRAGPPAPRAGGQPVPEGVVRPVELLDDRLVLRAGRPRLLPGRQEGPAADRVRAAHRPGRAAGGGPGVPRQHRRPDRVHRRRGGRTHQVRVGADGDGRGPRDDHHRADRRAARDRRAGLADRATRPRDRQARRPTTGRCN